MCGICNLFRCGRNSRRNSCDCEVNTYYEPVCAKRTEPRMNVHCASGIGTESSVPCGCRERRNHDCGCGCGKARENDCGCGHNHENDCDHYYENPYCD